MNEITRWRSTLGIMAVVVCWLFSCDPGIQSEEVISAEGETIQLTKSNLDKRYLAWSPDGRFIAYSQRDPGTIFYKLSSRDQTMEPILQEDDSYTEVTLSPDGKNVVYVVRSTNQLMLRSLEDNHTRELASGLQQLSAPIWSPDGKLVAFNSVSSLPGTTEVSVWIVSAEGGMPQKLTPDNETYLCGSFSADGKQIALYSKSSGNWEIWTVDIDDGELRQLTFPPDQKRFPAWSPDGKTIAYVSYEDTCYSNYSTVWLMPAGGGQPRKLMSGTGRMSHLAWSPVGDTLASADNGSISLISVSSGQATRLYYGSGSRPTWFPDGLSLLVSREVTNYAIHIVSVQDQQTNKLSDVKIDTAFYPVWIDAREVAFVRTGYIWKISTTGGNAVRLTHSANVYLRNMAISPDHSHIAFSDGRDIFLQSLQSAPPVNLTAHISESLDEPTWSPDGEQIACQFYGGIKIFALVSGKLVERQVLPGSYYEPAWSPNEIFGSQLAVILQGGIHLVSLDDPEPRMIVAYARFPAWSPDGHRLAYVRNSNIYITKVFAEL